MERQLSAALKIGVIGRTEMLKFEPDAMRAFVKYKLLKKLIGQCVDRRVKKGEEGAQSPKESTPLTEEEKEGDLQAMTAFFHPISTLIYRFIETIIEDVIAANQYYIRKLNSIKEEYSALYDIVEEELVKVRFSRAFSRLEARIPLSQEEGTHGTAANFHPVGGDASPAGLQCDELPGHSKSGSAPL